MLKMIHRLTTAMPTSTKKHLFTGICLLCLFLFAYTGFDKLFDLERFQNNLKRIPILGEYAIILSWLVPLSELLITILLIIPKTQKIGLITFTLMMLIFTVYISSMLLWAEKLPCSCGGVISNLSWIQHIWFNLSFIALSLAGLRLYKLIK